MEERIRFVAGYKHPVAGLIFLRGGQRYSKSLELAKLFRQPGEAMKANAEAALQGIIREHPEWFTVRRVIIKIETIERERRVLA